MTRHLSEDDREHLALEQLGDLMWRTVHGCTDTDHPGGQHRASGND